MSYHQISTEDLSQDKMSDIEDASYTQGSSAASRTTLATFDLVARYISYLVVLVLAVKVFVDSRERCVTPSHHDLTPQIHKVYGVNQDYFSLDSVFDYLWEPELEPSQAVIFDEWYDEREMWQEGVIGMFHQLHCLSTIRKALQIANRNESIGEGGRTNLHWPHCFWYLRQAILCAADDTIEHGAGRNGTWHFGRADGGNDDRICRNSSTLYELRAEKSKVFGHYTKYSKDRID